VYHTVKRGQTLYTISKVYGVNEIYLARINKISDPTQLRIGTRIYIPGATGAKRVPVTVAQITHPPKPKPKYKPPVKPVVKKQKPVKKWTKPATKKVTKKPASIKKTPVGKGTFIWPVKGKLVKKFNTRSSVGSKGIEVSARSGTPVSSAAAGKVIYSGDGISGYGNLLIIRHDDSFFTVYGYNRKNLVASGAFVSKGEKIALSGKPPSGGVPRIYFEIRYGKKPVNPISYLP
jgi:lipoprotein NlpD